MSLHLIKSKVKNTQGQIPDFEILREQCGSF